MWREIECIRSRDMKFPADMFGCVGIALLAVVVSAQLSTAQMRGGGGAARGASRRGTSVHHGFRHAHRWDQGFFPDSAFFYSDDDSDEPYATENAPPEISPVRRVVADEAPQRPRPAPLLIEWQGDRYVRFGGNDATAGGGFTYPDYAEPTAGKLGTAAQKERAPSHADEPPPVLLVYSDGHQEEVSDYAIADGVIYIHSNYWQSGYWTKTIPLSELDPDATIQANQQRGVKFMLPSAANEVIASF